MAYEFKSIADTDIVKEPNDSSTVLIEENGEIKRAPKSAVGGGSGFDAILMLDSHGEEVQLYSGDYQSIYDKLATGIPVVTLATWSNEGGVSYYSLVNEASISSYHDRPCIYMIEYQNWTYFYIFEDNTVIYGYAD